VSVNELQDDEEESGHGEASGPEESAFISRRRQ
jgi:hypothetical protein